jgi:NitT/TauT family transport system substrate-binding protein
MKALFNSIAVAFALGALPASGAASAQGKGETVRVADAPGIGNMPLRVAIRKGYCEKFGIKCESKIIPAAPLAVQTLLAGDLEVVFTASEVFILAAARGADVKILPVNGVRTPIFFLVGGAHLETPNAAKGYPAVMQDVKGKKIGVTARGSGAEQQLVDMLKGAGLSAADVTIVAVGAPNTAFPALTNKQVDAVVSFEPFGAICEVTKACRVVVDPRAGNGPKELLAMGPAAVTNGMRGDWAQKNPHVVEAFSKALAEANVFVNNSANLVELTQISQSFFKFDGPQGEAITSTAMRIAVDAKAYGGDFDPRAFQSVADYLKHAGQLPQPFDTSRMAYKR